MSSTTPHPPIASTEEWLSLRRQLLEKEKELTRAYDAVNAARRRLPMVKIDKNYSFEGPNGPASLADLFEGQRQVIVYHFMFDPSWDQGCMGCTGFVDSLGDLSMLQARNTHFVLISRAPLAKLDAYKQARGWNRPWFSSFGSDFNDDFHVTLDKNHSPTEYNFRQTEGKFQGEAHGLSVFFRLDNDDVFHTYSSYARGVERLTDAYSLLDVTPYGRQEDFEDSPPGWPQKPTYG